MQEAAEGPGRPLRQPELGTSGSQRKPAMASSSLRPSASNTPRYDASTPLFSAERRGAQAVSDTGGIGLKSQASSSALCEVELSTVMGDFSGRGSKLDPELKDLGECVQRAIEELGSDTSSAYIMFKGRMMKVAQIRPDVCQNVRRLSGVQERYLSDICNLPFEAAPEWARDDESSIAWMSSSGNFIIQVIEAEQVQHFEKIADRYLEHIEQNESMIALIVGIYDIALKTAPGHWLRVAVLKNFLPAGGRRLDYLYSLRGTEKDRFVQRTGVAMQLLRDANFVQEQQVVMLPVDKQEAFSKALAADACFLRDIRSVGYSLMVGIRKQPDHSETPSSASLASDYSSSLLQIPTRTVTRLGEDSDRDAGDESHSGKKNAGTPPASPSASWSINSRVRMQGAHPGWRPNARARNAEQVLYYFGIVDVLQPWNMRRGMKFMAGKACVCTLKTNNQLKPPNAYMQRFVGFIEDRVLPLNSMEDLFKVESLLQMSGPKRGRYGSVGVADALALVAGAEAIDEYKKPSFDELARWHALVDMLEAGDDAIKPWVELGLVEASVAKSLPRFKDELERRRLPEGTVQQHHPSGVALAKIGMLVNSVAKAKSLRGQLLSNSSKQYSLALAIAVGVEAVTQCSTRIYSRCNELFQKHPELVTRPASVASKRVFTLPEEGCWLSPPHMLPDLHFVEHAPEVFRRIRALSGMADHTYINCVCQREFSFIEFTTNSKSGEFFFFTHDGKCMVKTISNREARSLLRLLRDGYAEHLTTGAGSLLTRIYGLYQVQLPWFKGGKSKYFMIQENVLYTSSKIVERFDLKGSTRGRVAKPGESVQKDLDWVAKGYTFGFSGALKEKIRQQHQRDCEFLAACRVIDYSVLVGICDSPVGTFTRGQDGKHKPGEILHKAFGMKSGKSYRLSRIMRLADENQRPRGQNHQRESVSMILPKRKAEDLWNRLREEIYSHGPHGPHEGGGVSFFFGIIDFLVDWSCRKRTEYVARCIDCQAGQASVAPPWKYARRQISFFEAIL